MRRKLKMLYYGMSRKNCEPIKISLGDRSVSIEGAGPGYNWMGFERGKYIEGGRKTWPLAEFRARRAARKFLNNGVIENDG